VRCGRTDIASAALERLAAKAQATGTDWALGIEARSRALVGGADADYRRALAHLGRTRIRSELARTHLLYGEWLRGQCRRTEAREQLGVAFDLFTAMGMGKFAERARVQGERERTRLTEVRGDLTAQERQIAGLARDGLSNPEVGARLFLSPRTVEWHLRHVFSKLGIRLRRQLDAALPDD
jgi:ATP/maltotriose-dependent transcriptional regulator MalT